MPTVDVSTESPTQVAADLLIIPVFEGRRPGPGVAEVGKAMGADLTAVLKDNHVSGKIGESLSLPGLGRVKAKTILMVGLGPEGDAGPDAVRKAALKAGPRAGRAGSVASTLPQVGPDGSQSAFAFAEGLLLGAYRFDRYKQRPLDDASKEKPALKKVVGLAAAKGMGVREGLRRGQIYAEAANWARDLVNTPALDATPDVLAREARKMATLNGLTCKIWTKSMLAKGGFGGILGVGAGSPNEPRLIELGYRGAGNARPIAITGKGITFDSGGLSIKTSEGMEDMKEDMGGAAAALAAMRAIAQLKPKVNVIAAIPSAENMPDGTAIRPGDVLRHYGGKTSEVLNTDAEGRLVLADALAYLSEKKPVAIVDSATLTGAAMVALGTDLFALFSNDDALAADLLEAGREESEPGWRLPLWQDYTRNIESTVADMKNVGPRFGGAITAAIFLEQFVGDVAWAHLDVAGTAFADGGNKWFPRGATGSPARTLIRFVERRAGR